MQNLSPKNALCQVSLKLTQWFCRRRLLYFVNVLLLCCIYLPFEKGQPFIWIPITKGYFMPSLVEIGPVVLEKILKFRQCIFAISDDRRSEKLTWAFGSGELIKAKACFNELNQWFTLITWEIACMIPDEP